MAQKLSFSASGWYVYNEVTDRPGMLPFIDGDTKRTQYRAGGVLVLLMSHLKR